MTETVYTMVDHEGTLKIEYDDITIKTKLFLTRSGSKFGTLGIDEESFFQILFRDFHHFGIINQPTLSMLIGQVYILAIKFYI